MAVEIIQTPYTRLVPDTWEEHTSFHEHMRFYCRFTPAEACEYARKHLGPRPVRQVIYITEQIGGDDNDGFDENGDPISPRKTKKARTKKDAK